MPKKPPAKSVPDQPELPLDTPPEAAAANPTPAALVPFTQGETETDETPTEPAAEVS